MNSILKDHDHVNQCLIPRKYQSTARSLGTWICFQREGCMKNIKSSFSHLVIITQSELEDLT